MEVRDVSSPSTPEMLEDIHTQMLRRQILEIQNNPNFDSKEKARRTQALMTGKPLEEGASPSRQTRRIPQEDFFPTYQDPAHPTLGCKHYQVSCKIKAECCGRLFTCRRCHDEASDHEIDRYATKEMFCMICSTLQPIRQFCRSCRTCLAIYYCDICKFFDDSRCRSSYHCYHCNCCRVGKGLGIDYFHCMKCNACLPMSLRFHKCIEHTLEANCPICREIMFNSTTPLIYMPCGHCMHTSCYQAYIQTRYVCPICFKSVGDMSNYTREMDIFMESQEMPPEFRNTKSVILCNDCERQGQTKFHFMYHKCPGCGSYNTRIIRTINHPNNPSFCE
eukprot:TRINITY_DN14605_c0_g1_i1.p1 TRINITY_DN14605_c0_g1~~TRINITY_DN14605_c0_g1_i1.p1  ORF type:complete len:334 (+),score=37.99 TRINITY_DN14605_c0_g1_i1:37-1038(+)